MDGLDCPICGQSSQYLPTSSQWCYYCDSCCLTFNSDYEIRDLQDDEEPPEE